MKIILIVFCLLLEIVPASAQVAFIYDQQSATNDAHAAYSGGPTIPWSSVSQSFVPTLPGIGFVRLAVRVQPTQTAGESVYVNLWSGGIGSGTLLAASLTNYLGAGFTGYTNFLFSSEVALDSGVTYFLQPLAVSSGGFASVPYPNTATFSPSSASSDPVGMAIINGAVSPSQDMWYREGIIVVPEPTSARLLLLAIISFTTFRHKTKPG